MERKFEIAREKLDHMSVSERILLAFCYHPEAVDKTSSYEKPSDKWSLENALDGLLRSFPHLKDLVKDKQVLDYGCGDGFQTVAMANLGAIYVLGVDIEENRLRHARRLARGHDGIGFSTKIEGTFDVVVSLNAMEHFVEPLKNTQEMRDALKPGGKILISFGPPWYAPYGHHMYFFCGLPWINILFSERTVFRIRSLYRSDGATSYEPGLNRMSIRNFEGIVRELDLKFDARKYHCIKGINFLSKIPLFRELAINQVDAYLSPNTSKN